MEGLQKFLQILNDNWTSILVCAGLIVGIVKKTQDYMSKSQEEKIELAKKQIQTTILKMISDAEVDWQEWSKAGSIKRSQVIKQIYEEYPILLFCRHRILFYCNTNALQTKALPYRARGLHTDRYIMTNLLQKQISKKEVKLWDTQTVHL